jgi:hypothetical protein
VEGSKDKEKKKKAKEVSRGEVIVDGRKVGGVKRARG